MWTEVAAAFGGSVAALAVLGWLARSIVLHWLNKDVENYKTALKAGSESELERLRSVLRSRAFEHEFRFSRLHEKRLGVIEVTHNELDELFQAVEAVLTVNQGSDFEENRGPKSRTAIELAQSFAGKHRKRKIYLDHGLATKIDDFVNDLYRATCKFNMELNMASNPRSRYRSREEIWLESWDEFQAKHQPTLNQLQSEFRRLLGVEIGLQKKSDATENTSPN